MFQVILIKFFFVQEIGVVAKELGIEPFIIRDKELERQGFGGIYGVGKVSLPIV